MDWRDNLTYTLNMDEGRLNQVFGALAHATRRGLLSRLRAGEASVSELAEPYGMSLPAISRHLKVLETAGLIGRTVDGRFHRCHLRPEAVVQAADWIDQHRHFWSGRFDARADYIDLMKAESGDE